MPRLFANMRYDDFARITQQILSSWGGDRRRRETRMQAELEEDDEGKAEAQKVVVGAGATEG